MADETPETTGGPMPRPDDATEAVLEALVSQDVLPLDINPAEAISAVMCTLFQRLSGGEAQNLNEELPEALQSMLRPCAIHPEQPDIFDRDEFLQRVGEHLNTTPEMAEIVAQGVFAAIRTQITPRESKNVGNQLPVDLGDIWRAPPIGRQKSLDMRLGSHQIIFNDILAEVADQEILPSQVKPEDAVAAVMCVLSRRVSGGEARKLLKDLPRFLQEMVHPCAMHPEPSEVFERTTFIRRVAEHLDIDEETAERITNGVFGVIKKYLSARETHNVMSQLPGDLGRMWATAAPESQGQSPHH